MASRWTQYIRVFEQYIGGDPNVTPPGGTSVSAVGFTAIGQMYRAIVADGSVAGPSLFFDDGVKGGAFLSQVTTYTGQAAATSAFIFNGPSTAAGARCDVLLNSGIATPVTNTIYGTISGQMLTNWSFLTPIMRFRTFGAGNAGAKFGTHVCFSASADNGIAATAVTIASLTGDGNHFFNLGLAATSTYSVGNGCAMYMGSNAGNAASTSTDHAGWYVAQSSKTGAAANNDICGVFATAAPLASTTVFTSVFTTTLTGAAPWGATLTFQNMRAGALRSAFSVSPDGTMNHSPAVAAAITLAPFGAGAGQTSEIQFVNLLATRTIGFKSPDALSGASITFVWPPNTGSWAGQVMRVDGISPSAALTVDWAGIAFAKYTQQVASGSAPSEAGAPPTNASFVNPRTLTTLVNDPYALLTLGLPSASFAFSAVGTYRVRVRASFGKTAALTTICATKLRLRDTTAGTTAIVGAQKSIDSAAVGIVNDYVELDGYVTVTVGNLADLYAIQQWFNDGSGTDATSWGTALTTGETEQYVSLEVTKVL